VEKEFVSNENCGNEKELMKMTMRILMDL
jgi:hypothetical protein